MTNSIDELISKGNKCRESGNLTGALDYYRSALELDDSQFMVHMNMGGTFSDLSDWENALDSFEKAIKLDDKSELIWLNFGITHAKMNNFEKALECFEHSTQLDDAFVRAWEAKCEILDDLGRYDEAKVCGKKIYELTKKN